MFGNPCVHTAARALIRVALLATLLPRLAQSQEHPVVSFDTTTTAASRAGQVGTAAPPIVMTAWLNAPAWLKARAPAPLHFGDGHIYVLDFTAWWCAACPQNYSPLMAIDARYAAQGVRVLLVTAFYGKDLNYLREDFHKTKNEEYNMFFDSLPPPVTLPVAIDGVPNDTSKGAWDLMNARRFGTKNGAPWVFVVDQRGIIRYRENWPKGVAAVLDSLMRPSGAKRTAPPRSTRGSGRRASS